MHSISSGLRNLGSLLWAGLLALAVFGLVLTLLWALPGANTEPIKLAFTLASAAAGFLAGGMLSARLNPSAWLRQASAFGLLLGGASFVYIFGFSLNALLAVGLAALCSMLGGWLAFGRKARQ